jgi:hypothetical protein
MRKRGQGKTEYVLAVLLIGVAAITVVGLYGDNIRDVFATSDNALAGNENALAAAEQAPDQGTGGLGGQTAAGGQAVTTGDRASDSAGSGFKGTMSKPIRNPKTIKEAGDNPESSNAAEFKVSHELWSKDASAVTLLEGEHGSLSVGNFHTSGEVYGSYSDGELKAGFGAGVEVNALEGNLHGTIGDENELYGKGEATGKVLVAKANVDGSLSVSKEGVSANLEGGAEANLVEGEIGVEGGFRIPFTNWKISVGAKGTGQVGVGAKGHATATAGKDGFKASIGGKLTAGLGLGFSLDFGLSRTN